MTATPSWTYRPALDGVRGIAILLVLLGHAQIPGFASGGTAGVTLFFVLSGFLITTLLLEERRSQGTVDMRAFYVRRARRLLPALVVFLAVMLLIGVPWLRVLGGALYVGNWVRAAGESLAPMNHLWSLAVEEQFYLLWPLVVIALPLRARWLTVIAGMGMLAALVVPIPAYTFTSTTHAPSLMLGAALAYAYSTGWSIPHPRLAVTLGCLGLLAVAFFPMQPDLFSLAAIAGVLLTAGVLVWPVLTWRPLVQVGIVSYALYLWHFPVIVMLQFPREWEWGISIPVSLVLAAASWRYVERPFRRSRIPLRRELPHVNRAVSTSELAVTEERVEATG